MAVGAWTTTQTTIKLSVSMPIARPIFPGSSPPKNFFQTVRDHLTSDGVMVINVGRAPQDRRLIEALSSTILTVFPSVHVVDVPRTFNSILFATASPTQADNLKQNLAYLQTLKDIHPLLLDTAKTAVANLQPARHLVRSLPMTARRLNGSRTI